MCTKAKVIKRKMFVLKKYKYINIFFSIYFIRIYIIKTVGLEKTLLTICILYKYLVFIIMIVFNFLKTSKIILFRGKTYCINTRGSHILFNYTFDVFDYPGKVSVCKLKKYVKNYFTYFVNI